MGTRSFVHRERVFHVATHDSDQPAADHVQAEAERGTQAPEADRATGNGRGVDPDEAAQEIGCHRSLGGVEDLGDTGTVGDEGHASIAPNCFQVPGVPATTQTAPILPPAVGVPKKIF